MPVVPDSKISVDRQLEIRKNFRDETAFALAPISENAKLNYQASVSLADHAIKAGFALNGGALIALPTFAALLKVNASGIGSEFAYALGSFVMGLTANWLTSIFSYFSARSGYQSWSHAYQLTLMQHVLIWKQSAAELTDNSIEKEEKGMKLYDRWVHVCLYVAIFFAFVSLICFVYGACKSAYLLIHFANTLPISK